MAIRVILVRHGESSFNVEGRVQGHIDQSTLTDKGLADAQRVGAALQGIAFDAIYTSPLQRARQTAQVIHPNLSETLAVTPAVHDQLIEVGLPLWEGLLFSEVKERFPDAYADWHQQPHRLRMDLPNPDGGTTPFFPIQALFEQARQFWQSVLPKHHDQTLLLVGHSGINRALIATALGLSPERYHGLQQANCNITVLNLPSNDLQNVQLESLNQTDHLGTAIPQPRSGYQALRLLLVRHGETDWNRDGRFQGQIDVPLNDNGRHQGQKAADFLKAVAFDFAVSSPMQRPRETAELILAHHPQVPLTLDEALREISHGEWEGALESEIESRYPGDLERWRTAPATVQMPAGETLQDVWERAIAAWERLVEQAKAQKLGQTGLVVAHDAINKVILCHLTGVGAEQFWNFKQGNGAVSVIDFPETGAPILQSVNLTHHLSGSVLDRTAAGAL
uniref:histidine phosphatase family protein n=1 Tax=Petrachloros mirabilis TaxID=2918835 RepID=UPI001EE94668|nr:histidine phosphatase family protein [Petrachloros mirabilis]